MVLPFKQLAVAGVEGVQAASGDGEPGSEAASTVKPAGAVRFAEPRLIPVPTLFSFRNAAVIGTAAVFGKADCSAGTPAG
jgi:hypothetical protein